MTPTISINASRLSEHVKELMQRQPQLAKKAMMDCSQMMLRGARDRAPKRTGILVNSIRGDAVKKGSSYCARVFVPINSPAKDYAIPMHEWHYNLGELSLEKQAKVGVMVGRGYLFRGAYDQLERLCKCIEFVFARGIK